MIFSYADLGFVNIQSLDIVDYQETVYSINCEPYDNFFTENMLVFDTRDPITE
jgi:intein/homing endonuclease